MDLVYHSSLQRESSSRGDSSTSGGRVAETEHVKQLLGNIKKLDPFRRDDETVMRFEWQCLPPSNHEFGFVIYGPWRYQRAEAEADGERIKALAEQVWRDLGLSG